VSFPPVSGENPDGVGRWPSGVGTFTWRRVKLTGVG
jgi:hypothetical protein